MQGVRVLVELSCERYFFYSNILPSTFSLLFVRPVYVAFTHNALSTRLLLALRLLDQMTETIFSFFFFDAADSASVIHVRVPLRSHVLNGAVYTQCFKGQLFKKMWSSPITSISPVATKAPEEGWFSQRSVRVRVRVEMLSQMPYPLDGGNGDK